MASLEELASDACFRLMDGEALFSFSGTLNTLENGIDCGIAVRLNADALPEDMIFEDKTKVPAEIRHYDLITACAAIRPYVIRGDAIQFGESDALWREFLSLELDVLRDYDPDNKLGRPEHPKTFEEKLEYIMKIIYTAHVAAQHNAYPSLVGKVLPGVLKLLSAQEAGYWLAVETADSDSSLKVYSDEESRSGRVREFANRLRAYADSSIKIILPERNPEWGGQLGDMLYLSAEMPADAIREIADRVWSHSDKTIFDKYSSQEFKDAVQKYPSIIKELARAFGWANFKEHASHYDDLVQVCLSPQFSALVSALPDNSARNAAEGVLKTATESGKDVAFSLIGVASKYAAKPFVAECIASVVSSRQEKAAESIDFYNSKEFSDFVSLTPGAPGNIGWVFYRFGKESTLTLLSLLAQYKNADVVAEMIDAFDSWPRWHTEGFDQQHFFADAVSVYSSDLFNRVLYNYKKYTADVIKRVGQATLAGKDVGMKLLELMHKHTEHAVGAEFIGINLAEWVGVVAKNEGRERALEILEKYENQSSKS